MKKYVNPPGVDQLLLEQGEYSPLEWLLYEGRLDYADYESWRGAAVDNLESVLLGNPQRIRSELRECAEHARRIRLIEKVVTPFGWGRAKSRELRFAEHAGDEALYRTGFEPKREAPQMDLFFDGGSAPIVAGIIDAMLARDLDEAERLIERLFEQDPGHRQLGEFERLCGIARLAGAPPDDPPARLLELRDSVAPMAAGVFAGKARDYLTPLWSWVAVGLRDVPFDPAAPDVFAGFAFAKAWDWEGVLGAVEREFNWRVFVDLRLLHAQALSRMKRPEAAIRAWFDVFWAFPREAAGVFDRQSGVDTTLSPKWTLFRGLEPELRSHQFPSWCLISDPNMGLYAAGLKTEGSEAGRVFALVAELLTAGRDAGGVVSGATLKLRARLHQLDPDLFAFYLRGSFAARH